MQYQRIKIPPRPIGAQIRMSNSIKEAGIQCLFSTFDKGSQLSFDYDTASSAGVRAQWFLL
jgi:hypothetical protein